MKNCNNLLPMNGEGECELPLEEIRPLKDSRLLFLGGLFGLMPTFRAGGNGQPLAETAAAIQVQSGFPADTEAIERELFVPENHGA